jgi:5'-nucleotidase
VDATIPDDPLMRAHMAALAKPIDTSRKAVVGSTATPLNGNGNDVRRREATMANVIADALLEAGLHEGAELGLVSGGSVRSGIDAGPVTFEEVLAVQPFGNSLTILGLTGDEIWKALEYGLSGWSEGKGQFLHVSHNMRYTFDLSKPLGQQVVSVTMGGKPLERSRVYKVAMNNFMAGGGDNALVFKNASGVRINEPEFDIDVLIAYLRDHPKLSAANEGRITILNEPRQFSFVQ